MKTLYLNPSTWDLEIDSAGNIAVADRPYSLAQDVATAIRCFKGDCYYNVLLGVPYYESILGKLPSKAYIKSQFIKAAKRIENVDSAQCFITSVKNRMVHGQVQITADDGSVISVDF